MTTEATTTHTWKLDTRDDRSWTEWRWLCGCGSRGRWQSQHPSCASYAWAKHAGVDPFEVDEWGRATDDEPPMTDGSEDAFNDTCAWCGAPPRQKCSRDCTGPGQPLRSWPITRTGTGADEVRDEEKR